MGIARRPGDRQVALQAGEVEVEIDVAERRVRTHALAQLVGEPAVATQALGICGRVELAGIAGMFSSPGPACPA